MFIIRIDYLGICSGHLPSFIWDDIDSAGEKGGERERDENRAGHGQQAKTCERGSIAHEIFTHLTMLEEACKVVILVPAARHPSHRLLSFFNYSSIFLRSHRASSNIITLSHYRANREKSKRNRQPNSEGLILFSTYLLELGVEMLTDVK